MDQPSTRAAADHEIEIIPPQRMTVRGRNTVTCLCCQQKRLASCMDADGCGICEECLAPDALAADLRSVELVGLSDD